jgi:hypothetical protein
LIRIIQHYRELISKRTVSAAQYKIANRTSKPLLAIALQTVGERDRFICYADTPRSRFHAWR